MHQSSSFYVYNASAGSGKTFTLVKEYLKVLLSSEDIFTFQRILAITFTNKAAGEMKERVLSSLEAFANKEETILLSKILEETTLDKEIIKERSEKILQAILQNYTAFSITTIDSFTHKIIKNFAFDLGLSLNFEVEMDAASLLNEAVDVLISKIGTDQKLTNILIDYSLEKTDDDKSWDISRDLNEFSKILLNEDDIQHFRKLSEKSLAEFYTLKNKVQSKMVVIEKEFAAIADETLTFVKELGLQFSDFGYSGEYPKHFLKLQKVHAVATKALNFDGRLDKTIANDKNLFAAKTPKASKELIEDNKVKFHEFYYKSKAIYTAHFSDYLLCKLILKSLIPLAVLNNINQELENIKDDNNIRLNAEFNQLISDNIKEQPAPYIYERIGQRFQHYFIDEMQDTSILQWQNLIPLIDNTLAQENTKLLLVGDGKQAIYRWRGGRAEQFIALGIKGDLGKNPFQIDKNVAELTTNHRSYSEIVQFNNHFFQHAANFLENESYKKIFKEGNQQLENAKKGGFVALSFLEEQEDIEEKKLRYPKKVLAKIIDVKSHFSLGEICILTRTKKDGIAIANYLTENEIPIVSSETLLLENSTKVIFIIHFLKAVQNPTDEEVRFEILYFLHHHLQLQTSKHQFLKKYAKTSLNDVIVDLNESYTNFSFSRFQEVPFYEKVEEIIRGFGLVQKSDAYLQFFLDVVLEKQRKGIDIADFLTFWEFKKDKLSIVAPENTEAVQIMTIHKSKGLEFPVVIFPCDVDIYHQINPKIWLDGLTQNFEGFEEFLVPFNKDLQIINERGAQIYAAQREELELDNFNLLYVALTRAEEQLHIITAYKVDKNDDEKINHYSGVFINYLKQNQLWKPDVLEYSFGEAKRVSERLNKALTTTTHQKFISNPWQEKNLVLLANSSKLWDTEQGKAIDYGNLLHEIFEKIITKEDIDFAVMRYQQMGIMSHEDCQIILNLIKKVVYHPQLQHYFASGLTVFNEREILSVDHQTIIPDRLVFTEENTVVIIDYKTGLQSEKHHQQLQKYEQVLNTMQLNVNRKLLVYINNDIDVIEV